MSTLGILSNKFQKKLRLVNWILGNSNTYNEVNWKIMRSWIIVCINNKGSIMNWMMTTLSWWVKLTLFKVKFNSLQIKITLSLKSSTSSLLMITWSASAYRKGERQPGEHLNLVLWKFNKHHHLVDLLTILLSKSFYVIRRKLYVETSDHIVF